jgi:hypothetical protein
MDPNPTGFMKRERTMWKGLWEDGEEMVWCTYKPRDIEDCQPPHMMRNRKDSIPEPQRECNLMTSWSWTSALQNCKGINFCSKPSFCGFNREMDTVTLRSSDWGYPDTGVTRGVSWHWSNGNETKSRMQGHRQGFHQASAHKKKGASTDQRRNQGAPLTKEGTGLYCFAEMNKWWSPAYLRNSDT